jgi:hypothetical protein
MVFKSPLRLHRDILLRSQRRASRGVCFFTIRVFRAGFHLKLARNLDSQLVDENAVLECCQADSHTVHRRVRVGHEWILPGLSSIT